MCECIHLCICVKEIGRETRQRRTEKRERGRNLAERQNMKKEEY